MLVGTGQLIEQGCLAAVLVSNQGKGQKGVIGKGIFIFLLVILSVLSKSRVIREWNLLHPSVLVGALLDQLHTDLLGIRQAQGQLIAVHLDLHGIAHRGKLDDRELCSRDHAHVQKVLPEGAVSAHGADHRILSDCQFLQCHLSVLTSLHSFCRDC